MDLYKKAEYNEYHSLSKSIQSIEASKMRVFRDPTIELKKLFVKENFVNYITVPTSGGRIFIYKKKDDYYFLHHSHIDYKMQKYFICDQIEGVQECLNKEFQIN